MSRKFSGALAFAVVVSVALAPPRLAQAATISFDTALAGPGGTVSWAGGSAPLVGSGIPVGAATSTDTPIPRPPLVVQMGVLAFTTGPHLDFDPIGELHTFAGGGSITITGAIPAAGIMAPVVLLTGSFSQADTGSFGSINLTAADGFDFKHPLLLDHYGLSPALPFTFSLSLLTLGPPISDDGAFSRTAFSTSVVNTDVPEPSSLILLATALTALGIGRRWRR